MNVFYNVAVSFSQTPTVVHFYVDLIAYCSISDFPSFVARQLDRLQIKASFTFI